MLDRGRHTTELRYNVTGGLKVILGYIVGVEQLVSAHRGITVKTDTGMLNLCAQFICIYLLLYNSKVPLSRLAPRHSKQANDGNGLVPEKRNELVCHLQKSKDEFDQLNQQLKATTAQAVQLESEPKNEELIVEVSNMEKKLVEMGENITEMKSHAGNEKHVKLVKKEIQSKASVWRKRKRMCTEFLSNMEECTDGTISLKKCLKGDGQIDIDSDETALKGAIAFSNRKKIKTVKSSGVKSGVQPSADFVGCTLSAQGKPERVFFGVENA